MHRFSSTKRSEGSHLLDPSYFSATYTSQSPGQPRVYTDHQGNMHVPDYRPFPIVPAPHVSSTSSSHNVRRESSDSVTHDNEYDDPGDYFDPFAVHARRRSSLTRSNLPYYPSSALDSPVDDTEEEMECNSLTEVVRLSKWRCASLESMVKRRDHSETSQVDQSESKEESEKKDEKGSQYLNFFVDKYSLLLIPSSHPPCTYHISIPMKFALKNVYSNLETRTGVMTSCVDYPSESSITLPTFSEFVVEFTLYSFRNFDYQPATLICQDEQMRTSKPLSVSLPETQNGLMLGMVLLYTEWFASRGGATEWGNITQGAILMLMSDSGYGDKRRCFYDHSIRTGNTTWFADKTSFRHARCSSSSSSTADSDAWIRLPDGT
ncbi:hypothetical protein EDD85DRAFT_934993 [Armillaria nabsnona]|nr:hypothetical protein EDD85DRAFT_934993 [Armillaria nabsnona]